MEGIGLLLVLCLFIWGVIDHNNRQNARIKTLEKIRDDAAADQFNNHNHEGNDA